MVYRFRVRESLHYLHPPQIEEYRDKTKLGHGYKFYHYIIIYNSELGQLKEASLD